MFRSEVRRGQVDGLLSPFLLNRRIGQVDAWLDPGASVLDIGCGTAHILELSDKISSYVGIDVDTDILEDNRRRFGAETYHATFLELDVETQDLSPERSFDAIIMLAVLEHLRNPGAVVRKIRPLLRTEGKLLLTTPSPRGRSLIELASKLHITSRAAAEEHFAFYTERKLFDLMEEYGMRVVHFSRFLFGLNQLLVASRMD